MQPLQRSRKEGDRHSEVAEKAAAVALLFLQPLRKVEAAKNSLGLPCVEDKPVPWQDPSMFLRSHTAWSKLLSWTSPRSQEVAGQVLTLLLQVTECSSVAGFLHGENEDEKGRFTVIMGLLKPDLNK